MKTLKRKGQMIFVSVTLCISLCIPVGTHAAVIIDHNCTDISQIPDTWIDQVKTMSVHYAHTSHGEQITVGLERIEAADSKYSVATAYSTLPVDSGALCVFDGQSGETYIEPHLYWDSEEGMMDTNSVLSNNPTISVSMWAWCCQQDWNEAYDTQRYLDAMSVLEDSNPGVTFIYMTGNAQGTWGDGYNRFLRNNQIRDYCQANNKVLFDFADMDCWYNGEQSTYQHAGLSVPVEHPHYHGDEAGHTTYESCEQKGKAFWWMMARLAGWDSGTMTTTTVSPTTTSTVMDEQTCPIEEMYGHCSEEATLFRYIRDDVLGKTPAGQEIIRLYYEWGPIVVEAIRKDGEFKRDVKDVFDEFLLLIGERNL